MTTEITVNYRPDGTCDYVTVQLDDPADAEQIAGIALVLATASEDTDETETKYRNQRRATVSPAPCCMAEWVDPDGRGSLYCLHPAGHPGAHHVDDGSGGKVWTDPDPEPCGHQWTTMAEMLKDGDWVSTCTLATGHPGVHLDQNDNGDDAHDCDDEPTSAGVCGSYHRPPGSVGNYWCQLRAGHMSDHEDTPTGKKWPEPKGTS